MKQQKIRNKVSNILKSAQQDDDNYGADEDVNLNDSIHHNLTTEEDAFIVEEEEQYKQLKPSSKIYNTHDGR